jgi:hypothetical protein
MQQDAAFIHVCTSRIELLSARAGGRLARAYISLVAHAFNERLPE